MEPVLYSPFTWLALFAGYFLCGFILFIGAGLIVVAPVEKEFVAAAEQNFIAQQVSSNDSSASLAELHRVAEKPRATTGAEVKRSAKSKALLRWTLSAALLLLVAGGFA